MIIKGVKKTRDKSTKGEVIIPEQNKRFVVLPDDIKVQGTVYIGLSSKDDDFNQFLKIGVGTFLRTNTVIYLGSQFGDDFQSGHNAVIREKNIIGKDVVVGVNAYIGPGNQIGNGVKIHTGAYVEAAILEDKVIVSPEVMFVNDPYPPCKKCFKEIGGAYVEESVVIGANATILAGIKIGKGSLVGAGSVVTKDVPAGMVVVGNPARIIKKVEELKHPHG